MTKRHLLVLLVIAAVCGCKRGGPESGPAAEERSVSVRAHEVAPRTLERRISLVADVRALLEADVLAEASGVVEEMYAYTGDSVAAGMPLATIEHDELAAAVAEAEASVEVARVEANKASATRERTERARERDPDIISPDALDGVVAAAEGAAAKLKLAEAALQRARIRLDDAYARAPFAGLIGTRYVDPGAYVNVNEPLYHLVDSSTVRVMADVDERDLSRVSEGTPAAVRVSGVAEPVLAEVYRVSPVVDTRSRAAQVEIRVSNDAGLFRPGMFAKVELIVDVREGVLAVPVEAVLAGSARVWRVEDGRASLTDVTLGLSDGAFVQVISGLDRGDSIVVTNLDALHDGAPLAVRGSGEE